MQHESQRKNQWKQYIQVEFIVVHKKNSYFRPAACRGQKNGPAKKHQESVDMPHAYSHFLKMIAKRQEPLQLFFCATCCRLSILEHVDASVAPVL